MPFIVEGKEVACLGDPTTHGSPLFPGPGAVNVLYNGRPVWRTLVDFHACPMVKGTVPDVGGLVLVGAVRTLIGGVPVARKSDIVVEVPGGPNPIVMGMAGVSTPGSLLGDLFDSVTDAIGDAIEAIKDAAAELLESLSEAATEIYHRIFGEEYSDGITIHGPKDYRDKVRARLDELRQQPSGQQLIDALDEQGRNGKGVDIYNYESSTDPINATATPTGTWQDAYPTATHTDPTSGRIIVDTPGAGTSTDVHFNPDTVFPYADGSGNAPSSVVLGHELIHARHNGDGTNLVNFPDASDPGGMSNHEEAQTIGRGAYTGDPLTENTIRNDMGLNKPRNSHYGL